MSRSSARLADKHVIKREVVTDVPSSPRKARQSQLHEPAMISVLPPEDFMEEDSEPSTEVKSLEKRDRPSRVVPLTPVSPIEKKRQKLSGSNSSNHKSRASIHPDMLPIPSCSRQLDPEMERTMEEMETPLVIETRDELNNARKKLEYVLTNISKNELDKHENLNDSDYDHGRSRRSPGKKGKRPKQEEDESNSLNNSKTPALVLKLFDRSVDLAKFTAGKTNSSIELPLYPVCREWIRNGRSGSDADTLLTAASQGDGKRGPGIYHLPKPLAMSEDSEIKSDKKDIQEMDQAFDSVDVEQVPQLLAENIERWKSIRLACRDASAKNESRYKHSCDVLKAMFEKSMAGAAGNPPEPLLEPKVEMEVF